MLSFPTAQSGRPWEAEGEEALVTPSIQEAKAKHTGRLLALPGVVSVGIGLDAEGRPAIVIGVEGREPEEEAELPRSLEGHPVVTQVVGALRAR